MIFVNPFIAQNEVKGFFWTCFAARALSTTKVKTKRIMRTRFTRLSLDEMNGIKNEWLLHQSFVSPMQDFTAHSVS